MCGEGGGGAEMTDFNMSSLGCQDEEGMYCPDFFPRGEESCPEPRDPDPRPLPLRARFKTKEDLVDAVRFEALKQGKTMMQDRAKKGPTYVTLGCADKLSKRANGSCGAFVSGCLLKNGQWSVAQKSFNMEHMNCNGEPKISGRMLRKSTGVRRAVIADQNVRGKVLQSHAWLDLNVSAGKRMMFRVRDGIRNDLNCSSSKSYYFLEPWARKFRHLNTQSSCRIEWCANGEFKRLFLMHEAAVHVFKHSAQSLVMEDCAFMKSKTYNGQFMAMSFVDGNLNNVLLAQALTPKEDQENYEWFFNQINSHDAELFRILNGFLFTHISDRNKGLAAALGSSYPAANKMSCFKHIVGNITNSKHVPGLGPRVADLWAIQGATTSEEFENGLKALAAHNDAAVRYLRDIPGGPQVWALHKQIQHGIAVFGKRTSNTIESENARYLEARDQEPFKFLHMTCRMQLQLNNTSRQNAAKWARRGMLLTQAIHNINKRNEGLTNGYFVTRVNDRKALVQKPGAHTIERTVTFGPDAGLCSCTEWGQMQYPCRHAIAANRELMFKADVQDWYEYAFSGIYLLSNYKKAYENPGITPPSLHELVREISHTEDPEGGVKRLAPPMYQTAGRPAKKRKRKRTETAGGQPVKVYTCGTCGSAEHNKRRCPRNFIDLTGDDD